MLTIADEGEGSPQVPMKEGFEEERSVFSSYKMPSEGRNLDRNYVDKQGREGDRREGVNGSSKPGEMSRERRFSDRERGQSSSRKERNPVNNQRDYSNQYRGQNRGLEDRRDRDRYDRGRERTREGENGRRNGQVTDNRDRRQMNGNNNGDGRYQKGDGDRERRPEEHNNYNARSTMNHNQRNPADQRKYNGYNGRNFNRNGDKWHEGYNRRQSPSRNRNQNQDGRRNFGVASSNNSESSPRRGFQDRQEPRDHRNDQRPMQNAFRQREFRPNNNRNDDRRREEDRRRPPTTDVSRSDTKSPPRNESRRDSSRAESEQEKPSSQNEESGVASASNRSQNDDDKDEFQTNKPKPLLSKSALSAIARRTAANKLRQGNNSMLQKRSLTYLTRARELRQGRTPGQFVDRRDFKRDYGDNNQSGSVGQFRCRENNSCMKNGSVSRLNERKRKFSSTDGGRKMEQKKSKLSYSLPGKLRLDDLHGEDNTADEYDELMKVEKWVRSAPDELYYTREVDGHAKATERTQILCDKFQATLLSKCKIARDEAERLGELKMNELIDIENIQLAEQRHLRKLKKLKRKCCSTTDGKGSEKDTQDNGSETSSSVSSPQPASSADKDTAEESAAQDECDKIAAGYKMDEESDNATEEEEPPPPGVDDMNEEQLHAGKVETTHEENEMEQGEVVDSELEEEHKETLSPDGSTTPDKEILELQAGDEFAEIEDSRPDGVDSMEEGELVETSADEEEEKKSEAIKPDKVEEVSKQPSLSVASDKPTVPKSNTPVVTPPADCSKNESLKGESKPKTKHKVLKKKSSKHKKSKARSSDSEGQVSDCSDGVKSPPSSSDDDSGSDSSSSSDNEEGFSMTRSDTANRELERRKKHPRRLHAELWHNDPGLMNDGPVCRCSAKARRFGIRHGFYPGEEKVERCDHFSNNKGTLYHYRITISPPKNFLISTPTVINHDGHEYIFEGFSIFSHYKLDLTLPPCKVIRFNIRYDVFVEEEKFPESFCVKELLLFETYLFREILELVDLKYDFSEDLGCSQFHLMPRFVRQLPDNGQEILSMSRVLIHLLKSDKELVREEDLSKLYTVEQSEWQNFADRHKGTIVTKWGMKPCAIRVDQIDRDVSGEDVVEEDGIPFPLIVHFGIRPPQLSYAGNAGYQRAWRRYVKYRHLLSNMPKPSAEDKLKLLKKEMKLQAMRTASNMKRDVTVDISSRGFRTTGICCDLVQHAMLIPVLVAHLRFHRCLRTLEECMEYPFQNRYLLQLAMTHPSYRENFGTNPDHARNALTNCGIRQPEYGDRRIHYASTRKRGINTLINIMAKFGADQETESEITHNERLEFLGDAVVEFVTSIHLFHIFPDLEEGGLATYRAAIVQNQHLAVLAQTLNLDQYMLYAHGSDLCHDSELRHAMANCFEALMGALFLDGNIEAADRVFGSTLFGTEDVLSQMWSNYPKHPLQQEEPNGDRFWVKDYDVLKRLSEFESSIGVTFNHIRLLARAFTDRSLGYNNLTRGSNQRLEFLGDTVLQLISSEYLYRHFPDHHEGHLSLLRSSLVNNRTQSLVCDDLGMPQYAMRGDPKSEMKTKDRADLLEAFLGALYIDKGLPFCHRFCQVCFFPRLSKSITKQEWNDPKSKLQQCCLTLRAMDGREPDIPVYKVTESLGPTNTRTYIVAVYFRSKRLATAQGHSIQEAEMNAAALALESSGHLFPQLHHQKRIMDKTKQCH